MLASQFFGSSWGFFPSAYWVPGTVPPNSDFTFSPSRRSSWCRSQAQALGLPRVPAAAPHPAPCVASFLLCPSFLFLRLAARFPFSSQLHSRLPLPLGLCWEGCPLQFWLLGMEYDCFVFLGRFPTGSELSQVPKLSDLSSILKVSMARGLCLVHLFGERGDSFSSQPRKCLSSSREVLCGSLVP